MQLGNAELARGRFAPRRTARRQAAEREHPATEVRDALSSEQPSRFRAGALRPVVEEARSRGQRAAVTRSRRLPGWFERALLAAEILSAIVVLWVVAQYVYTAYIDTSPRRVAGAARAPRTTPAALSASAGLTSRTPLADKSAAVPTSTPRPAMAPKLGVTSGATPVGMPGDEGVLDASTATVQPLSAPSPTPTVDPALLLPSRLRIPAMFLDSPVHEVMLNLGVWEVSPMDIGHHEGTANPGERGNMVLAGHRDINSALFRELDRLEPGDEVFVSNSLREYRYVVTESMVVTPDHTEIMDPTDDKRATLITCTPIGLATQRLVVTAMLDETYNGR